MPVHDWARVDAGTFHDFHNAWITHIKEALNEGLLPNGYYALAEQHAGLRVGDMLALHGPGTSATPRGNGERGGLALALAPPRVQRRLIADAGTSYRLARRTLAVRHVSGHRVVALMEIVSPANKDRDKHVADLVSKIIEALGLGIHVALIDLFRPGPADPRGVHGAVWEEYGPPVYDLPADRPLTLASYLAEKLPEAFVEHLTFGETLIDMPIFLDDGSYVPVPLEATYQAAYRGMPAFWRDVLDR